MQFLNGTQTIKVAVVVTVMGGLALPAKADDLFSRRPLHPVIESPQQVAPPSTGQQPQQPSQPQQTVPTAPAEKATIDQVESLLRESGLEVKDLDNGVLGVKVKSGTLEIPMLASLSPDKSNIWLIMILKTVDSTSDMTPNRLMGLMEANQKYGPAFFTFSRQTKQIQLRRAVSNHNMTASHLKLQIDIMALVVTQTTSLWSGQAASQTTPSESKSQPQSPAVSREVGRWVVELKNGGGFALLLNADGSFVLMHRKPDGTADTSRGTYTLADGKLTLKISGEPDLVGKVTFSTNNEFKFVVGNGSGLNFKRA
jgi:hypothetical protein